MKNKNRRLDYIYVGLLIIIYSFILLFILKGGKYTLGSKIDFYCQHFTIPDYFRTLFLKTRDFFPDFAFNLGGGTNIYNFSYYGLLSPLFFFSLLMPKIPMVYVVNIYMFLVVISSIILFYRYLRKDGETPFLSFILSLIFLTSGPFIFHTHRHIMFVMYMPFLIMGYYGIDRLLKKKNGLLLTVSSALIIFSNYYFSVSALVSLFIYGIYRYFKLRQYNKKDFIKYLLILILHMLLGVLTASVLLLPSASVLLNGRTGMANKISLLRLLSPRNFFLYTAYCMGFTLIVLIGLISTAFEGKKEDKALAIFLILTGIIPLINYPLNGFLYINGKALIPFVPLVLMATRGYFRKITTKGEYKKYYTYYIIISSIIFSIIVNKNDKLISRKRHKYLRSGRYITEYKKILEDEDFYRINTSLLGSYHLNRIEDIREYKTAMYSSTFSNDFHNSYKKQFNTSALYTNNLVTGVFNDFIFNAYMGEKYVMARENLEDFYEKIGEYSDVGVYKNKYYLPIMYATDRLYNSKDLDKEGYPLRAIYTYGGYVNDKVKTSSEIKEITKEELKLQGNKDVKIKEDLDTYKIKTEKDSFLDVPVDSKYKDKLVFINFKIMDDAPCTQEFVRVRINNITNVVTCHKSSYFNQNNTFHFEVVPRNANLKFHFLTEEFEISKPEMHAIPLTYFEEVKKSVIPIEINKGETKGDVIKGSITLDNEKHIATSIPYDEGFTIKDNGKIINYEKINGGFIGFKLSSGKHDIDITYEAPYKKLGLKVTVVGLILTIVIVVYERKKYGKN